MKYTIHLKVPVDGKAVVFPPGAHLVLGAWTHGDADDEGGGLDDII